MQLASSGVRTLKPTGRGKLLPNNPHNPRQIHIPSFVPRGNTGLSATSTAQTLFKHTRTLLSRFVTHLATPGTLRLPQNVPAAARSISHGPAHARTIQQGLSLPARIALSRPLQAPHLPRVPAIPRGVSHVGLGLARNFSTGRPVFQNLVENVPVSGRAFWEADWDVNMQKEREKMRLKKFGKGKDAVKKSKQMMKPKAEKKVLPSAEEQQKAELDHYFPAAANPEVKTHLLIPLAPTETSRLPLPLSAPSNLSAAHPLLPLSLLGDLHSAHSTQALRVSSLFARLDAAHVFELPEVRCEAHGDPSGLCTLLEITFEGWDEAKVRSILGEAGQGWCVLEEVRKDQDKVEHERMDEMLEMMSSDTDAWSNASEDSLWQDGGAVIDPAGSLVLPTLDFSASFGNASIATLSPPAFSSSRARSSISDAGLPLSDIEFHNAWSEVERELGHHGPDVWSDTSSDRSSDIASESSWIDSDFQTGTTEISAPYPSLSGSWFGFSSAFEGRLQETEGPREDMF